MTLKSLDQINMELRNFTLKTNNGPRTLNIYNPERTNLKSKENKTQLRLTEKALNVENSSLRLCVFLFLIVTKI